METTNIKKFENRTKNAIRLLAFLEAKKWKELELERILLDLIPPTLQEPGNIAYVLHKSVENPQVFMFDELWVDEIAIEEHFKQQPPYAQSNRETKPTIGKIFRVKEIL